MTSESGLEVLERVAAAGGKILRAEGDRAGASVGTLLLTFDVGRVLIRPTEAGISISEIASREDMPDDFGSLEEEDPWWRLLGQPLTAAWPGGVEEGVGASGLGSLMVLKLRFREEGENPRIVQLEATGPAMRVSLEAV